MTNQNSLVPKQIDFFDRCMAVDGTVLTFPLSLAEIIAVLGEPRETPEDAGSFTYIYHNAGLVFNTDDADFRGLKKIKAFVDEAHSIVSVDLYFGDAVVPKTDETLLPQRSCRTVLTFN